MKKIVCFLMFLMISIPVPVVADFGFDDLEEVEQMEQTNLLELARQAAKKWKFSKAKDYLDQARNKSYAPDQIKDVQKLIADNRQAYEAKKEKERLAKEREEKERNASGNKGGRLNCSSVSSDYGLWQYCDHNSCTGLSNNYALYQLCQFDDITGLGSNYAIYNYLKNGDPSGLSKDYNVWLGAKRNAGSYADRKRWVIFYLRGYLYGHM